MIREFLIVIGISLCFGLAFSLLRQDRFLAHSYFGRFNLIEYFGYGAKAFLLSLLVFFPGLSILYSVGWAFANATSMGKGLIIVIIVAIVATQLRFHSLSVINRLFSRIQPKLPSVKTHIVFTFDTEEDYDGTGYHNSYKYITSGAFYRLVEGLADRGVTATFYLTPNLCRDMPEVVRYLADRKQTIGVHLHPHNLMAIRYPYKTSDSPPRGDEIANYSFRQKMELMHLAKKQVESVAGRKILLFRSGRHSCDYELEKIAKGVGYEAVSNHNGTYFIPPVGLWNLDSGAYDIWEQRTDKASQLIKSFDKISGKKRVITFTGHPMLIYDHASGKVNEEQLEQIFQLVDYLRDKGDVEFIDQHRLLTLAKSGAKQRSSSMKQLIPPLDKALAFTGIIFGAALAWLLRGSYVELGITLSAACIVYLLFVKRAPPLLSSFEFQVGRQGYLIANILFFGLFIYSTAAIILNNELYVRPTGYFIAISLLAGLLSVEIFTYGKAYPHLTLFKILLIGASLQWIPQGMFPSLTGIDVFGHNQGVSDILNQGHIPPDYLYARQPMMSLVVAITSLVTGLSYKFSGMFSAGFLYLAATVFIFLIAQKLFNTRIGLLSALLVAIADWFTHNGLYTIPNTLGMALVVCIAWMLFSNRKNIPYGLSFMLMLTVLIMTHALATFIFSVILISFWVGSKFYRRVYQKEKLLVSSTIYPLLFGAVIILVIFGYWLYVSPSNIDYIRAVFGRSFGLEQVQGNPLVLQYLSTVARSEVLLNRGGLLLFYFLAIIGILAISARELRAPYRFSLVSVATMMTLIAFLGGPLGLRDLIPERSYAYSEIFLSIPAALGLLFLSNVFFNRKRWKCLMLFILAAALSFLLISNPTGNRESPIYSRNTAYRLAFTQSEVQAAKTISHIYDGQLFLGLPYDNLFPLKTVAFGWEEGVNYARSFISRDFTGFRRLALTKPFQISVIIREYEVKHLASLSYGYYKLGYDPRIVLEEQGLFRFYDSQTVSAFLPGDISPLGK